MGRWVVDLRLLGVGSRRGHGHDPAPVTPHNALFPSYKTLRLPGADSCGLGQLWDGSHTPLTDRCQFDILQITRLVGHP
jgi:hypothetical protein